MTFRIKTSSSTNKLVDNQIKDPTAKSIITTEDIDLIEQKYKDKEAKIKKIIEEPANPVLAEYRKNLVKEDSKFTRQKIIYDKTTNKWRITIE